MKHPHAEKMKKYAELALITPEPWKYVQYLNNDKEWTTVAGYPSFGKHDQYSFLDPYADLKQAFQDGCLILIGGTVKMSKSRGDNPKWELELDKYEIIPKQKPENKWDWLFITHVNNPQWGEYEQLTKKEAKEKFKDDYFYAKIKGTKNGNV
jgi:hypothetical protein